VRPAESVLKPWRLRYELKRKMGGKSIGRGWKGRRCWAATRVAVSVGAMEFSKASVSNWRYVETGKGWRTAPCCGVAIERLFRLFWAIWAFGRHWHLAGL
jgi:hypothetical protein